ncbi:hypothetical protein [Bartonella sp. DGB2]|uniref:hypothetical protein n=1 Tax=Bartonella sp. DGB2 TaxID=3388426 RepID=UPI0039900325
MGHRPPTITQPAIARALREAKKLGCDRIAIRPDGEVVIYLHKDITPAQSTSNAYTIDDFLPAYETDGDQLALTPVCRPVADMKF